VRRGVALPARVPAWMFSGAATFIAGSGCDF
jgi:hypothetical protein